MEYLTRARKEHATICQITGLHLCCLDEATAIFINVFGLTCLASDARFTLDGLVLFTIVMCIFNDHAVTTLTIALSIYHSLDQQPLPAA